MILYTVTSVIIIIHIVGRHNCTYFYFSKWKSCEKSTGSSMVYQLGKLEAASIYFNTDLENGDFLSESWRKDLKLGLETFSVNEKSFDFGNEAFPVTEFCV